MIQYLRAGSWWSLISGRVTGGLQAQPRDTSRNLCIGCGEGLGEVSPSVKTTPDWANDLFYSSLPARERVTWESSHTCLSLARGVSLHCHVFPMAMQPGLGQSSCHPSCNTLLCYVLPGVGKNQQVSKEPAALQPWGMVPHPTPACSKGQAEDFMPKIAKCQPANRQLVGAKFCPQPRLSTRGEFYFCLQVGQENYLAFCALWVLLWWVGDPPEFAGCWD